MDNYELKINGKFADVGKDFGIRLNRQIVNPSELNTKDAQMSFNITLPSVPVNNEIFKHANIEETRDKFNRIYTAELNVNGVRVFPPAGVIGYFRPSNISDKGYKGNLYIPVPKTVKDIFGETKLNANPEYRIDFEDFAEYVSAYNLAAASAPQPAIFPMVLYGVLLKGPLNKNGNTYSARDIWDASVQMSIQTLPPSINVLIMLKHIFNARGYILNGSAFDDVRLTKVYMSYKNSDDYVQPWNYGQHAKLRIRGSWSSKYNKRTGAQEFERGVSQGSDSSGPLYGCDFLDATNTKLEVLEDTGGNVIYNEVNDASGRAYVRAQIRIPVSGFYKVEFNAGLKIDSIENWRATDSATGVQHVGGRSEHQNNALGQSMYEIRLCRDKGSREFGINNPALNGRFYYNNLPQNTLFDAVNIPKYFPQNGPNGQLNFIDSAQDNAHLMGFNFGWQGVRQDLVNGKVVLTPRQREFNNPKAGLSPNAQVLVSKPALSWDASLGSDKVTRLAVDASGYWKYGRIGDFDNEGDNPTVEIDYSAGDKITGQYLDINGIPRAYDDSTLTPRKLGLAIASDTGEYIENTAYQCSILIKVAGFTNLRFTGWVPSGVPNIAVVSFLDAELNYIGYQIKTTFAEEYFTNERILAPYNAEYVQVCTGIDDPLSITATNIYGDYVILNKFPLERWFNYKFTAPSGSNYSGYVFLYDGATATEPVSKILFEDGVALVDTSIPTLQDFDPHVTLYLATTQFNVDGTLEIDRRIDSESSEVIGYELSNKYKIDLDNAPLNFAKVGQYDGAPADANWHAQGSSNGVVWLEAGELLTVASISGEGAYRRSGMHTTYGWTSHEIKFDLSVQPFRTDADWLKVNLNGNGTAAMDWNDPPNFITDSINLVGFLSADIKTDDFIDNFCKAFNLRLSQTADNVFKLDVKQNRASVSNLFLDLDNVTSIRDRENLPLGLPKSYNIGFTVDQDEQGFVESGDDGGGSFATGALEGVVAEQKSSFSYNWFKRITKTESGGAVFLDLPVISKSDVWSPSMPYPEAMTKRYTDLAYRFWYYDGLLNDSGATFQFNGADLKIAKVSNEITGLSILNYKNQKYTILDNYFTVLINGSSHYTEVEGYITPAQYQSLDGAIYAMFNRDLYFIAELTGYDPTAKNKTKLKLIRKI